MGWTIGVAVVLVVLASGWVFIRGAGALSELQNVRHSVAQLRTAIIDRDLSRANRLVPRIVHHAAVARDLTSDPVWRGFEFVPWLGPNLTAVREIAEVADDVAADALKPLVGVAADVDLATVGFSGSRVETGPLVAAQAPLASSSAALNEADARAQRIDADTALPPLADAVRETRDLLREATTVVGSLHAATELLPVMLGGQPHTYLLAVQDNTEIRSQGGVVRTLMLMHTDDGAISILQTASSRAIPALEEALPMDETTAALFGDGPGRSARDATALPEFAAAGETLAQHWQRQYGGTIDGVIAIDIMTLQHLVEAAGSVTFGEYTADSETELPGLLAEIDASIPDAAAADAVFAQAAAAVISSALSSDPAAVLGALAAAAGEDRIRIWSTHPREQAVLAASDLGGAFPSDGAIGPYIGVLINDTTEGGTDARTDATIFTAVGACHGEPTTQVRVVWTNDAPADAGEVSTRIAIYGPEGAKALSAGGDDVVELLGTRSVVQQEVSVAPGESATVSASFTGEGAGDRFTRVQHTPMADAVDVVKADVECE